MELTLSDRIAQGNFADIFAPHPAVLAYKLFKRSIDPHWAHTIPLVCSAEVRAYELATADPALAEHVPRFHGSISIAAVRDSEGFDISDNYWLDLCYVIDRLEPDPEERKFGSFFNEEEWASMEPLEKAFRAAGIHHVGDASVLHWRTQRLIVIDFATHDAAADNAIIPDSELE